MLSTLCLVLSLSVGFIAYMYHGSLIKTLLIIFTTRPTPPVLFRCTHPSPSIQRVPFGKTTKEKCHPIQFALPKYSWISGLPPEAALLEKPTPPSTTNANTPPLRVRGHAQVLSSSLHARNSSDLGLPRPCTRYPNSPF